MTAHEFDLVVVGAGLAGWTAARRAQQLGADVVVLEKHTAGPGFGNTRLSGGWFHAAYLSPLRPPDELYEDLTRKTEGHARPELVRAWADNVARALEFLKSEGGEFAAAGEEEGQQHVLQPVRDNYSVNLAWRGRGPDRLLTTMWTRFINQGGTFRAGRRAAEILVEAGDVTGVVAEVGRSQETYKGRAVFLADGGFHANSQLVARYITTDYKLLGSAANTGDALKMATTARAKTTNMEWFYGQFQPRDSLLIDGISMAGDMGRLVACGILVDGFGARFADEGSHNEVITDRIAKCTTPDACWIVFDDDVWQATAVEGAARRGATLDAINPSLSDSGGTVLSAESIHDLATQAGLPIGPLSATVGAVNQFLRHGSPLDPPMTSEVRPIDKPPFHAIPVVAGITFTMGGLLVNQHAQVLDEDENQISGLYAAGGTMGGLQGGPGFGYSGGWSEAATFAILGAEHFVAHMERQVEQTP